MKLFRAIVLLLAVVNPFGVNANILTMIGVGGGTSTSGGGGVLCSVGALKFNLPCNAINIVMKRV